MSRITLTAHWFTFFVIFDCLPVCIMLYCTNGVIVLQGGLAFILHRMGGVMLMDKKTFDFKDLIAFGMFILALLTFVFTFIK